MKFCIYAIYFPTSKKRYIGQTNNIKRRMSQHLENNSLIGNALRKYDDWAIEILHTTKDRDAANLLEIEEIRHYNCVAPNGYNLTRGGEGNDSIRSEEIKQKLRGIKKPGVSKANKQRRGYKRKAKGGFEGRKHSKESLEKMSNAQKGNQNGIGNKNMLGKRHTKEAKIKMSNARKGGKRSEQSILKYRISRLKTRLAKLESE